MNVNISKSKVVNIIAILELEQLFLCCKDFVLNLCFSYLSYVQKRVRTGASASRWFTMLCELVHRCLVSMPTRYSLPYRYRNHTGDNNWGKNA